MGNKYFSWYPARTVDFPSWRSQPVIGARDIQYPSWRSQPPEKRIIKYPPWRSQPVNEKRIIKYPPWRSQPVNEKRIIKYPPWRCQPVNEKRIIKYPPWRCQPPEKRIIKYPPWRSQPPEKRIIKYSPWRSQPDYIYNFRTVYYPLWKGQPKAKHHKKKTLSFHDGKINVAHYKISKNISKYTKFEVITTNTIDIANELKIQKHDNNIIRIIYNSSYLKTQESLNLDFSIKLSNNIQYSQIDNFNLDLTLSSPDFWYYVNSFDFSYVESSYYIFKTQTHILKYEIENSVTWKNDYGITINSTTGTVLYDNSNNTKKLNSELTICAYNFNCVKKKSFGVVIDSDPYFNLKHDISNYSLNYKQENFHNPILFFGNNSKQDNLNKYFYKSDLSFSIDPEPDSNFFVLNSTTGVIYGYNSIFPNNIYNSYKIRVTYLYNSIQRTNSYSFWVKSDYDYNNLHIDYFNLRSNSIVFACKSSDTNSFFIRHIEDHFNSNLIYGNKPFHQLNQFHNSVNVGLTTENSLFHIEWNSYNGIIAKLKNDNVDLQDYKSFVNYDFSIYIKDHYNDSISFECNLIINDTSIENVFIENNKKLLKGTGGQLNDRIIIQVEPELNGSNYMFPSSPIFTFPNDDIAKISKLNGIKIYNNSILNDVYLTRVPWIAYDVYDDINSMTPAYFEQNNIENLKIQTEQSSYTINLQLIPLEFSDTPNLHVNTSLYTIAEYISNSIIENTDTYIKTRHFYHKKQTYNILRHFPQENVDYTYPPWRAQPPESRIVYYPSWRSIPTLIRSVDKLVQFPPWRGQSRAIRIFSNYTFVKYPPWRGQPVIGIRNIDYPPWRSQPYNIQIRHLFYPPWRSQPFNEIRYIKTPPWRGQPDKTSRIVLYPPWRSQPVIGIRNIDYPSWRGQPVIGIRDIDYPSWRGQPAISSFIRVVRFTNTFSQPYQLTRTIAYSNTLSQPYQLTRTIAYSNTLSQPYQISRTIAYSNTLSQPYQLTRTIAYSNTMSQPIVFRNIENLIVFPPWRGIPTLIRNIDTLIDYPPWKAQPVIGLRENKLPPWRGQPVIGIREILYPQWRGQPFNEIRYIKMPPWRGQPVPGLREIKYPQWRGQPITGVRQTQVPPWRGIPTLIRNIDNLVQYPPWRGHIFNEIRYINYPPWRGQSSIELEKRTITYSKTLSQPYQISRTITYSKTLSQPYQLTRTIAYSNTMSQPIVFRNIENLIVFPSWRGIPTLIRNIDTLIDYPPWKAQPVIGIRENKLPPWRGQPVIGIRETQLPPWRGIPTLIRSVDKLIKYPPWRGQTFNKIRYTNYPPWRGQPITGVRQTQVPPWRGIPTLIRNIDTLIDYPPWKAQPATSIREIQYPQWRGQPVIGIREIQLPPWRGQPFNEIRYIKMPPWRGQPVPGLREIKYPPWRGQPVLGLRQTQVPPWRGIPTLIRSIDNLVQYPSWKAQPVIGLREIKFPPWRGQSSIELEKRKIAYSKTLSQPYQISRTITYSNTLSQPYQISRIVYNVSVPPWRGIPTLIRSIDKLVQYPPWRGQPVIGIREIQYPPWRGQPVIGIREIQYPPWRGQPIYIIMTV